MKSKMLGDGDQKWYQSWPVACLSKSESRIKLVEEALERDKAFFGELQCTDTTIIIFCDDDKLISKLCGDKDTITSHSKKNYISVSDEYLNIDIIAHEFTHAELHTRLNMNALKSIPTWFDEGLATQNDYREQYSSEKWIEQTDNGKNVLPLEDMDTETLFLQFFQQSKLAIITNVSCITILHLYATPYLFWVIFILSHTGKH